MVGFATILMTKKIISCYKCVYIEILFINICIKSNLYFIHLGDYYCISVPGIRGKPGLDS